jgi:CPA2 family monovalent cation:H+ antiporter-2
MVLTPFVSSQTSRLYSLKKKLFRHEQLESMNFPEDEFRNHIVIAGYGRIGSQISRILKRLALSFVVVELDQQRVEQAKAAGIPVVYGDGSQEIVQEALAVERASLLVITIPSIVTARTIISNARKVNAEIKTVARISDPDFFAVFKELQVGNLVYPEFEAGLEMIRQVLLFQRIPVPEIQQYTEELRQELLAKEIAADNGYHTLGQMRAAEQQFDLQWVELESDNPLNGRSIAEAEIRKATGVSVVGIIRLGELTANPAPDFRFQQGDLAAIIGSASARQKFHCFLNPLSEKCLLSR